MSQDMTMNLLRLKTTFDALWESGAEFCIVVDRTMPGAEIPEDMATGVNPVMLRVGSKSTPPIPVTVNDFNMLKMTILFTPARGPQRFAELAIPWLSVVVILCQNPGDLSAAGIETEAKPRPIRRFGCIDGGKKGKPS